MPPNLLLLTPTEMERQCLLGFLPAATDLEICGFGPIAAASETARLIAARQLNRVCLIGIAGTYDANNLPVGTAIEFESVACWGVGVGEGDKFQSPAELGFPQMPLGPEPIHDVLKLNPLVNSAVGKQLLTVCAASANGREVQEKRHKFPQAIAEDMEAFAVALACARRSVTLSVVRGISNVAGDRDKANWRIHDALRAAARHIEESLSRQISKAR